MNCSLAIDVIAMIVAIASLIIAILSFTAMLRIDKTTSNFAKIAKC